MNRYTVEALNRYIGRNASMHWDYFTLQRFNASTLQRFNGLTIYVMLLARVEGNVVATRKHPSLEGWRLLICQPINNSGEAEGAPQIAIDAHGAGMHQRVVISSDGSAARKAVGDPQSPARWLVVGIVDEKEPGVPV